MEELCEFIIFNADYDIDNTIITMAYSYNEFSDLDNCIKIIYNSLDIKIADIVINKDNFYKHSGTIISFKFKGRKCELYESQKNYLYMQIMPFEW